MVVNHGICEQYLKIECGQNMRPTYSENKYCKNMPIILSCEKLA